MALKRTLSLTLLSFYGLGTILGAGIYALIGSVAQEAKDYTAYSFIIASFIALFTAASYAELSSRFPQSAGSALYIRKAFNNAWFSGAIGWMVVLTGVVSSGAMAHGFANYISLILPIPAWISIVLVILLLGGLALWGIHESATGIMWMTIIEITGLLIVIWIGAPAVLATDLKMNALRPSFNLESWSGIILGAFVAFYAFIGFEDMVNTAEETINPQKTLPYAIFIALFAATILYIFVALVVVKNLTVPELNSKVPLTTILTKHGMSPFILIAIALISIMNGVLVQIIMASRLIYGMSKQNNAPAIFATLTKTQTPLYATLLVLLVIILLALTLPIETLAKSTSTIMLVIFILIHITLIKIKLTGKQTTGHIQFPIAIPIIGGILAILFLASQFYFSLR